MFDLIEQRILIIIIHSLRLEVFHLFWLVIDLHHHILLELNQKFTCFRISFKESFLLLSFIEPFYPSSNASLSSKRRFSRFSSVFWYKVWKRSWSFLIKWFYLCWLMKIFYNWSLISWLMSLMYILFRNRSLLFIMLEMVSRSGPWKSENLSTLLVGLWITRSNLW